MAPLGGEGAACGKGASFGRMGGAGHFTGEDDARAAPFEFGVGDRYGGEEGLCVGMQRRGIEVGGRGNFNDISKIHDGDSGGEVFDHAQVVGDEEVGEAELFLEVFEEVDDLRLDGDVEGREGLVADEEFGSEGKGSCNSDALTLPTAEFVGKPLAQRGA